MLVRNSEYKPDSLIDRDRTEVAGIAQRGKRIVYGFLAVFAVWGTFVPLQSSITAQGVITTSGNNKLLQHVQGGRIRTIELNEGAHVTKGDLIMVLDTEVSRAELSELQARQAVLLAKKERLQTVKYDNVAFSKLVNSLGLRIDVDETLKTASTSSSTGQHEAIFASQELEQMFDSRAIDAEVTALRHEIRSLERERNGVAAMLASARADLEFLRAEIRNMRPLVQSGYLARKELWDRSREENRKAGELADFDSRISQLDERISEAKSRADGYLSGQRRQLAKELTSVLGELAEIRDRLVSAERALKNTEIRAPVTGTLIAFSANTIGGVVRGGDTIGEIVPDGAPLIIEAKVRPQDIADVSQGQAAQAEVIALDRRRYDPLAARLTYVSADSIKTPDSTEPYYLIHAVPDGGNAEFDESYPLKPGMDVKLYVNSGSRPFLVYLFSPLVTSFESAFNEP